VPALRPPRPQGRKTRAVSRLAWPGFISVPVRRFHPLRAAPRVLPEPVRGFAPPGCYDGRQTGFGYPCSAGPELAQHLCSLHPHTRSGLSRAAARPHVFCESIMSLLMVLTLCLTRDLRATPIAPADTATPGSSQIGRPCPGPRQTAPTTREWASQGATRPQSS
jgi:hypothetical protein